MPARHIRKLIRIYIGELDKVGGEPLHEAIVRHAFDAGLDGVTVWRGTASFGGPHQLHLAKILRLSEKLPVIVDIVETPERADQFLEVIDRLIERAGGGGLVTVQEVEALIYDSVRGR